MCNKFKKIVLTNPENNQVVMKKEFYSNSSLTLLQRWVLYLKVHSTWKLKYQYEILFKKIRKKHFAYENPAIPEMPLVYSCSGCSSAAQMANYIAVQLDRNGIAEMSCIVGVGGNVNKLVRTAVSGRKIITIDGCPLACSRACLGNHSIHADGHFELTAMGVKKQNHTDFDLIQAQEMLVQVKMRIKKMLLHKELHSVF
jgi:uncharacterized metal-binding protein